MIKYINEFYPVVADNVKVRKMAEKMENRKT